MVAEQTAVVVLQSSAEVVERSQTLVVPAGVEYVATKELTAVEA